MPDLSLSILSQPYTARPSCARCWPLERLGRLQRLGRLARFARLAFVGLLTLVGLLGWASLAQADELQDLVEAKAASAEPVWTPEQRLDAIRRALVKASLEGATKVETVSWIDADGVLRDSASFRSNMRVRGVQILAYKRNEQGEPEADLGLPEADEPVPAAAPQPQREDLIKARALSVAAQNRCPRPVPGLRQVMGVDVVLSPLWQGADRSIASDLVAWTLRDLGPNPGPWLLQQRPPPPANAYEAALLATPMDQAPWRARLVLTPLAAGKTRIPIGATALDASGIATPPNAWQGSAELANPPSNTVEVSTLQVQWQWQVWHLPAGSPVLQETGLQEVLILKSDWAPRAADPLSRPGVQKMLFAWVEKMRQVLACEILEAQVTQIRGQELSLNMGSLSGLKVGDAWLVADLPQVALHTLEPQALSKTVLAEVRQLFPNSARLQIVAGQASEVQGHWKAWPADALSDAEPSSAQPH